MALGIKITPLRPNQGLFKGRKVKLVRFAGDNAKPTGGYTVTSAQLGLRLIEGCVMGAQSDNNLLWAMNVDTTASTSTSTNQATLQAYTAVGSGANATASATAVSIAVVTAMVYGF